MSLIHNPNPLEFENIVETYYSSLYRFGMSLSGREADAGDLTQQTFLIWAEKGNQLRDLSKIKTWLFTTLYREFLRSKRRNQSFPHQSINELEEGGELLCDSSTVPESLDSQKVLEALQRLDPVYREPLALFYLQDTSYKEIAEVLEIPIGTVMSRLARAKAMLRKQLELVHSRGVL